MFDTRLVVAKEVGETRTVRIRVCACVSLSVPLELEIFKYGRFESA